MKRAFLAGYFSVGLLAAGLVLDTPQAKAACLTGDLSSLADGNGCLTFDPSTQSNAAPDYAYVQYLDPNINVNTYFQMAFYDANVAPLESTFNITDIEYGFTSPANTLPTTWTPFTTSSLIASETSTTFFTNIVTISSTPTSNSLYIRYRITADASLLNGAKLEVNLLSNSDGNNALDEDSNGPLLVAASVGQPANGFVDLSRYNTVVSSNNPPAPGPLPIAGALAAFGVSRQLRRRIRQAG
jgi:hypothetical protein